MNDCVGLNFVGKCIMQSAKMSRFSKQLTFNVI